MLRQQHDAIAQQTMGEEMRKLSAPLLLNVFPHCPVPVVCFSFPVCATGLAGVINLVGVVISFGFVQYSSPSLLSSCYFQGLVLWTGAGLYYSAAVVRVGVGMWTGMFSNSYPICYISQQDTVHVSC